MSSIKPPDEGHDCTGCPVAYTRRSFLRDAVTAALATVVTAGYARAANALPVSFADALRSNGKLHAYAIPSSDSVQIDKDNEVILVRWQNSVYAFNLSCPHQNTALRWDEGNHRFQCPKHKSQYQPDGEFISGRATRAMDRLAIKREGNAVSVDIDTMYRQDTEEAAWTAAVVKLA